MNTDETQIIPSTPPDGRSYPHRDLTQLIIGAAQEVHRTLGRGFLEKVYETALLHELKLRRVEAVTQAEITVSYKGSLVGYYYADLLVGGVVLCEIKAGRALVAEHEAQLLNYLKSTGTKVGLLLNFGTDRLQVKRMVF